MHLKVGDIEARRDSDLVVVKNYTTFLDHMASLQENLMTVV